MLIEELLIKKSMLEKVIERSEEVVERLKSFEGARLRIACHGQTPKYYYCKEEGDANGKFLPKDEEYIAKNIAEYQYNKSVLKNAKSELVQINKLIKCEENNQILAEYEKMNPARKKLVTPYLVSNEEFAQKWQEIKYEGKPFADGFPEIYTRRGERVRSKSEKIIADTLYARGIPYRYESPLKLKGFGTVYPDFTVLNVRKRKIYYHEHFGMMSDEDYSGSALKKIETYERAGFFPGSELIITHETKERPLDTEILDKLAEKYYL